MSQEIKLNNDLILCLLRDKVGIQCVDLLGSFWDRHSSNLIFFTIDQRIGERFLIVVQKYTTPDSQTSDGKQALRSQAATMRFLAHNRYTPIPVPRVLWYHDDLLPNNLNVRVGADCMVIKEPSGLTLEAAWHTLSPLERRSACMAAADCWIGLMLTTFYHIGSIHEINNAPIIGPMGILPSNDEHCIIPPHQDNCGPFLNEKDWLHALRQGSLQYLSPHKLEPRQTESMQRCKQSINALPTPNGQPEFGFVLEHINFSPENILVSKDTNGGDQMKITAVMGWEGARTVPMWATRPTWRWPESSCPAEQVQLKVGMQDRISWKVPGWANATGRACEPRRVLYNWASHIRSPNPEAWRTDPYPQFY